MTTDQPDLHTFDKISFRLETHSLTGLPMIEIRGDGRFIGAIYQTAHGLRFMSKYAVAPVVVTDRMSIVELLYEEIHAE